MGGADPFGQWLVTSDDTAHMFLTPKKAMCGRKAEPGAPTARAVSDSLIHAGIVHRYAPTARRVHHCLKCKALYELHWLGQGGES